MGRRTQFHHHVVRILASALLPIFLFPLPGRTQAASDGPVEVRIYVDSPPAVDLTIMARARRVASVILADAGVRLTWPTRAESGFIFVDFDAKPGNSHSGEALAFTFPYDRGGPRIHILYDRIAPVSRDCPRVGGILLGHVLAHEIIHVLERIDRHSPSGVMKARWDGRDYVEMQLRPLSMAGEDILLIRMGLKSWFINAGAF